MRDMKYDIARSVAMIWVVGIYHLSEYLFSPLHELQWARMVTWGCLGTFTFISAYFLAGKNEFNNWTQIRVFYGKRLLRLYPLFVLSALTFLDAYDLGSKSIIPFFTYGAKTYLNESMQKIYRLTPGSEHIPATLPEDLDPDDITTPGRPDDAGIDMPGNAGGVEAWLGRIGFK